MESKRKIALVGNKFTSFAEAEDADVVYYASLSLRQRLMQAEELRKMIWEEEYKFPAGKEFSKANLKDDRDGFE